MNVRERFGELGYGGGEIRRIESLLGHRPRSPSVVAAAIDAVEYDASWGESYDVCSVSRALAQSRLTCISAAILATGLLECFPDVPTAFYAIHRVDPAGNECGHVFVCYEFGGRYGAIAKSNYAGLNHREAIFPDEKSLVLSYAKAYVRMGFTPTYYGRFHLDEIAHDLDWRQSQANLSELTERLTGCYRYQFAVRRAS